MLRIIGYGSMLGVRVEPQGSVAVLLASVPVLFGPTTLVLLMVQPAVRRWEGWFACLCSWTLLIVLMLQALQAD